MQETIDDYFDCDKVDLSAEGFDGYILTKDGRIWHTASKYGHDEGWSRPRVSKGHLDYGVYPLYKSSGEPDKVGNYEIVNANQLVSKYFVEPTMMSMPDKFKRLDGTPLIVSRSGAIYDTSTGRFRRPSKGGKYLHFSCNGKYYNVHRVVAELFVPNPNPTVNDCVNHLDPSNRWNNDASNLEWCTRAENNAYSRRLEKDGFEYDSDAHAEQYQRSDGKRSSSPGIASMMVHVAGPNFDHREQQV